MPRHIAGALALSAVLAMTSAAAHADEHPSTAGIPGRHADIVSRVENLDGTERTVDQDQRTVYALQSKVLFTKDSARLSAQAHDRLHDVATKISRARTDRPIGINGYTDNLGSAAHGLALSRARAEAVLNVLKGDPRLAQLRFTATGHGEADPIGDNENESGRAKNRRVEIVISRS
ncbi:OmpA family protein [Streptomyces sp. NPDC091416]|uniref:OmpA family protein n=1 Tax=Streptomyces sp. NPDC091416 TaxID=3366003 RepID=UPI0037F85D8C